MIQRRQARELAALSPERRAERENALRYLRWIWRERRRVEKGS